MPISTAGCPPTDDYDPYGVTLVVEPFLDDLTNWYVRRSRRRFWKSEQDADKDAAYATLYHVLVTLSKLLAPMVPFVTEVIYQNLVRTVDDSAPESVHHCQWPKAEERGLDTQLSLWTGRQTWSNTRSACCLMSWVPNMVAASPCCARRWQRPTRRCWPVASSLG